MLFSFAFSSVIMANSEEDRLTRLLKHTECHHFCVVCVLTFICQDRHGPCCTAVTLNSTLHETKDHPPSMQ
jgi:hypothetical protein